MTLEPYAVYDPRTIYSWVAGRPTVPAPFATSDPYKYPTHLADTTSVFQMSSSFGDGGWLPFGDDNELSFKATDVATDETLVSHTQSLAFPRPDPESTWQIRIGYPARRKATESRSGSRAKPMVAE